MNIIKKLKIKRTVAKVNKALDIKLNKWQINYIFNDGRCPDYYTRRTGKTLANILKTIIIFNKDTKPIIIDDRSLIEDTKEGAKISSCEDGLWMHRRRIFINELLKTQATLKNVKGLKVREIVLYK